jgi:hypothetical protein
VGLYAVDWLSSGSVVSSAWVNITVTGTYLCGEDPYSSQLLYDSSGNTLANAQTVPSGVAKTSDVTAVSVAISALPTAAAVAAEILSVPANKLGTNSDGTVKVESGVIAVTIPAAVAQASQTATQITCLRGDTLSINLPLMGNIVGRSKLVLTVKLSVNDDDAAAILQIMEGTGLVMLNGSSTTRTSDASLTVNDATIGSVSLTVGATTTSQLMIEDLVWDVQAYLSNGIVTPLCGTLSVVGDVTRSVI